MKTSGTALNQNWISASADLIEMLVDEARDHRFNRQGTGLDLDRLLSDGAQLIEPLLLHRHINGEPASPHQRCLVWVELRDEPEHVPVQLDIDLDLFIAIADAWALQVAEAASTAG